MPDKKQNEVTPKKAIYRKKAEYVIEGLRERNMNGMYCATKEEAVETICSMIPAGSLVGLGGSVTVVESGLIDALRKMDIRLLDRYKNGITKEETDKMRKESLLSDVFIASSNALTQDGVIVNEDGFGNRVAGMIYGPAKVILIVGMNKVVSSVEAGVDRIKNVVAPVNCIRLNKDTPCAQTGFCDDEECAAPGRICSQLVIIESNSVKDRINVVLVGEELGF